MSKLAPALIEALFGHKAGEEFEVEGAQHYIKKIRATKDETVRKDNDNNGRLRRTISMLMEDNGLNPSDYENLITDLIGFAGVLVNTAIEQSLQHKSLIKVINLKNKIDSGEKPDMSEMLEGLEHITNLMRTMREHERRERNDKRADAPEPIDTKDEPSAMGPDCNNCTEEDCPAHPKNVNGPLSGLFNGMRNKPN